MNRLHDLKNTLPDNLKDSYGNVEFVLLDYGSRDGLGEWVKSEMMDEIHSGKLVYYYTSAEFFQPNHSRNVSFRLAKNDLVVNVDADNYMGGGFLRALNECSVVGPDRILIVPKNFLLPNSDRFHLRGRFAMYRQDIYELGGFDEDLDNGFSHDDVSFVMRAMLARFKIVRFDESFTSRRIHTTDEDRTKHVRNKNFSHMKEINQFITSCKLGRAITQANQKKHWGKAIVHKNFQSHEAIQV
jgi:glycosyltransferase involved in cell wall biosynthesis